MTENLDKQCNEYYAEKIIDKQVINGRPIYLVKWCDFSDDYNTWEPIENLKDECYHLINHFNNKSDNNSQDIAETLKVQNLTINDKRDDSGFVSDVNSSATIRPSVNTRPVIRREWPSQWTIKRIRRAAKGKNNNKIYHFVEWMETREVSVMSSELTNHHCPQQVIQFYEIRSVWKC
ncbi:chromobox protein homolog 5-like [Oppia nitens]|uniref:chromobox protein homolog 5-like n=1 Tax=Oppia nitens TaxID=1686743 RepID=UPI0023DABA3B|nr:chromobox protein homolog 5-like [Oppia nitens]